MEIRFLKTQTIASLTKQITSNLELYKSGSFEHLDLGSAENSFQSSTGSVNVQDLEALMIPDDTGDYEAENSWRVFSAFPCLSRYEAADPRLWTYYCHLSALDYTRKRYSSKFGVTDEATLAKNIHKHYFAVNNSRELLRNNSLARLWWNCRIATDVDPEKAYEILEVLLINTDFRAQHVERPLQFSTNAFKGLIKFARQKYIANRDDLYFIAPRNAGDQNRCKHYNYRHASLFLNRLGGWVNLSILSVDDIAGLICEDEAKRSPQLGVS